MAMTSHDVLAFLDLADAAGAKVWLDGGWAVDACLGAQTRPHADLDIAIEARHLPAVRQALERLGYRPVPRDDTSEWNFVLGDPDGRLIDLHVVVFDDDGNGVLGPVENGDVYPAGSLTGHGVIDGRPVDCVAPDWLVRFHTGYDVDEDDWADVQALCERFRLPVPADYDRWRS